MANVLSKEKRSTHVASMNLDQAHAAETGKSCTCRLVTLIVYLCNHHTNRFIFLNPLGNGYDVCGSSTMFVYKSEMTVNSISPWTGKYVADPRCSRTLQLLERDQNLRTKRSCSI
jgi:hypothetical protein